MVDAYGQVVDARKQVVDAREQVVDAREQVINAREQVSGGRWCYCLGCLMPVFGRFWEFLCVLSRFWGVLWSLLGGGDRLNAGGWRFSP